VQRLFFVVIFAIILTGIPLLALSDTDTSIADTSTPSNEVTSTMSETGNFSATACLLEIMFETDSDWTTATMSGIGQVVMSEYEILQGEEAPDLSISAASPTLIQVNKEQYDMTTVKLQIKAIILNPAGEVELVIKKGHIGKTAVTLYKWNDGQFEFFSKYVHVGVNETSPEENPAVFSISTTELFETRIGVALEKPFSEAGKLVLAFHYPWYATPYGPSKRWFHWEGTVKEGWIDTSTHFPLFGAYDSADEETIEAQMLLAQHAGIDGFISSWWGKDTFEDQTFPKILTVAERLNFRVSPYYESYRPSLDPATVAGELTYLVERYSNSSAFLKIGETPVIFVYAVQAQDREPEFWIEVRTILEEKVGRVFLIGDLQNPAYVSVFDGFHIYAELDLNRAKSIYEMFSEQMNIGADALDLTEAIKEIETTGKLVLRNKLTCGTVIPGYDDRKIRSPGTLLYRMSGETYQEYWRTVQESSVDWVLITSWNEWHEGTEVEPSVEYGFQYLTETREFASQFKDTEIPEREEEPDLLPSLEMSGNLDTLEVTMLNTGDGPAIATRVEIDLGGFNANVVSSSPYPHDNSNTVNYIPLTHGGESTKVLVQLSGITNEAITISELSIRYFSVSGELKEFERRAIRLEKTPSCFIATATYGTPMAEEIQILRQFRDEYLLTNSLGQAFVDVYYKVSPPIADFITDHPGLKPIVRVGLMPVVVMCSIVLDIGPEFTGNEAQ
jgi:glycoprotein endo-alpha-1,2-mannosidase